ncbi:neutral/alkaline non-lysosomal ceramidase N-terminal domain-containing protein [uncultured Corynebacterium sp.]|uniref:neutral/alkaline non-lysosomal ceramidase N-terminal domain-containing protein n=1 Tax=uncultured Corynebacterium sp. TaxID=159447 RepID=UPI0025E9B2B8|nr:neutral/alkaline non-lysosomal ceramidase N-terminal domain-containing protein [uncultured Corynebacterium sp.]
MELAVNHCCSSDPTPSVFPVFESEWSRRKFFGGLAAVSGTVLWASVTDKAGMATAQPQGNVPSAPGLQVGRAMADITGEPWGAGFNGYAVLDQTAVGIQRRQYARVFIFADEKNPKQRVIHVTADIGLMFQSIHLEVLRRLRKRYGSLYGEHNVLITATHTHVAPGGTSQHLMVDLTTAGFRPVTFEATVKGIVDAIVRAHEDLSPADVTISESTVEDAGRNRSRPAWNENPEEDKRVNPSGVDTRSVTVHVAKNGRPVGLINWYSIHPTSFSSEYRHIASDNKGYAAWATEEAVGVDHRYPEKADFVAAFSNATPGDITPNHGLVPKSGPGKDERESAKILGDRMMEGVAKGGFGSSMGSGGVDVRFRWVDCTTLKVDGKWTPDGKPGKLGPAILGAAFAASSQEDGGGEPALGLNEGERGGTPWVKALNKVTIPPNVADIHGNKELLLPLGYLPGMIQQTHPFYIHRIGGLVLVALGFEPTITSGLRLRRTVADALGVDMAAVLVQGYTNSYGHYLTTPEEYQTQNYEGGATIFGKNQLPAFQQVFHDMAMAMKEGKPVESGQPAGDLTGLIPKSATGNPWLDTPPAGKKFGAVLSKPASVKAGATVSIEFVGANPNNNLRHGEGYLTIEDSSGKVIANDSSETTLLTFANQFSTTTTTVEWNTTGVAPGEYTVRYRGDARAFLGRLTPFEGSAKVKIS